MPTNTRSATWNLVEPLRKCKDAAAAVATIPELLTKAETPAAGRQAALKALNLAEQTLNEELADIRAAIKKFNGEPQTWTGG